MEKQNKERVQIKWSQEAYFSGFFPNDYFELANIPPFWLVFVS